MRALKTFALVVLLVAVLLSSSLAWLVRSEAGSRWLLEQGLRLAPITIEVAGISGTLRRVGSRVFIHSLPEGRGAG